MNISTRVYFLYAAFLALGRWPTDVGFNGVVDAAIVLSAFWLGVFICEKAGLVLEKKDD